MSGEEVAIFARVVRAEPDTLWLTPVVPRLSLLSICAKHPRIVYFDGPECPCCELMAENRQESGILSLFRAMPKP